MYLQTKGRDHASWVGHESVVVVVFDDVDRVVWHNWRERFKGPD
jgi:hypothetical protein